MRQGTAAEVRLDQGKEKSFSAAGSAILGSACQESVPGDIVVPATQRRDYGLGRRWNLENVG
jgi:hypothetical protein